MTTAANQYAIGHAAALQLLAELQQAIEDMPDPESINGDWGYAGNMSYVNGQLRELLAFAGGHDARAATTADRSRRYREQIPLAMAAKLKQNPVLQGVPVHITRPMTLRDRVTLAPVEIVYGTEQPPVINVEDYAFFDPSMGEPWEDDSDA